MIPKLPILALAVIVFSWAAQMGTGDCPSFPGYSTCQAQSSIAVPDGTATSSHQQQTANEGIAQTASTQEVAPERPPSAERLAPRAGQSEQGSADSLLEAAIEQLESRFSISSKIRFQIDLFGHEIVGSGSYLEERAKQIPQIRYDVKLQLGQRSSSLLKVCDGRYFWTFRQLGDEGKLERIDVLRLVNELGPEGLRVAQAGNSLGGGPALCDRLGGLSASLRNLADAFEFNRAPDRKLGDTPMWVIEGRWKPARLAELLPDQAEAIKRGLPADTAALAPHLPDRVVLWLGKEDRFPYRIEYARRRPHDGTPPRSQVVMQWFEVGFDREIGPSRFQYRPPEEMEFSDRTQGLLDELKAQ